MGLWDQNVSAVRRLVERAWRDLANLAIQGGTPYPKKARLELKLTLRVYDGKKRPFVLKTSSNYDLDLTSEPRERGPKHSLWERLMRDD